MKILIINTTGDSDKKGCEQMKYTLLLLGVLALTGCGDDSSEYYSNSGTNTRERATAGNFIQINATMISSLRSECSSLSANFNRTHNLAAFEIEVLSAKAKYESCFALWGWQSSCNADAVAQLTRDVPQVCNDYLY